MAIILYVELLKHLTLLPVTTISQIAAFRWWQLVHVKSTTVTHSDALRPSTAAAVPMKAHFATDNALLHCRMPTRKPTWCIRTTLLFRHTCIRHLLSCASLNPIPALTHIAVAFDDSPVALSAISLIQSCVG